MRDWLIEAVERHPDRPFVEVGNDVVTFGRMGQLVGEWVGGVRGVLEPGSRLGVWARNDLESIVSILAAPRAGLVPLLLNPRWTEKETQAVLTRTATPAVRAPDTPSGEFVTWESPMSDSIHSVVFTSGSTGEPKGVRLTWANLEASAAASARHLGHTRRDRWLAVLPLCHVGGLSILTRSLRQGSSIVLEPRFDGARVASLLSGGVSLVSLVSATLRAVLDEPSTFEGVRAALVGGGPVPRRLVEEAWVRGLPVLPTYGMTETASQVATASLTEFDPEKLTPLPGVAISIVDGRIAIDGPMVSPGYLDESDREPGRPFVTGDAGALDGHTLVVFGRADDVIITGGENVHPAEVEARLREHPAVRDAAVVGIPDPTWGSIVGAVVEGDVEPGQLTDHLRAGLASYKIPRRWLVVAELPRLGIGKVDRADAARRLAAAAAQSE